MEAKGSENDFCISSAELCQFLHDPSLVVRFRPSYCNTMEFEAVPCEVWGLFFSSIDYLQKILFFFFLPKGKQTEETALSDNLDACVLAGLGSVPRSTSHLFVPQLPPS